MNDTATHASTHQDPFTAIQETEAQAERGIEHGIHKNAEAVSEARIAREEALKAYEEELKAEGMTQLKEAKEKASSKMESELSAARSEAESLKNTAKNKMHEAVKLITDNFKNSVGA